MPSIKVASICPTTEKSWDVATNQVVHSYAYPGETFEQAVAKAKAMVEHSVTLLERAAEHKADFACLPEILPNLGRWRQKIDQPTIEKAWDQLWDHFHDTMSTTAARLNMHIVAGAVRPHNGHYYNAAVLFDDQGTMLGAYHKVQLAGDGERARVSPGDSFPVFETRHGMVGMSICWDMMFPEVSQALRVNGAQILFHPTYGHAGGERCDFIARTRAHDAAMPIVISMWCGNGRIVDKDGTFLAKGGFHRNADGVIPDQILYAELDLGKPAPLGAVSEDLREQFYAERQWQAYRPLVEGPLAESQIRLPDAATAGV